jgi:small conductance mechanosensitive channel
MWSRFFEVDGPVEWKVIVAAVVPTLVLSWLGARMAKRLVRAAIRAIVNDTVDANSPLVRGPLRIVSLAVFILLVALFLFPAFELAGLRPRAGVGLQSLGFWILYSGWKVLLIALFAYGLVRATALLVSRFEHELNKGTSLDALERAKRARTLGSVINKVAAVVVTTVAFLMALGELGIDITPVLTGAGIVGLAVGFGAQTLVRDIISGFFMILEDQVRVGDVAMINGTGGLVEAINLRTIVLRDNEGVVHIFPNGGIQTLANRTKDHSFYVIDLDISYREDTDRVAAMLRDIAEEMRAEDAFAPFILAPLEIMGVDAFREWSVVLKVRIKTMPLKQWEVGREFRRRIRKRFEEAGIQTPFPERIVSVRDSGGGRGGEDGARGGEAAKAAG